MFLFIQYGLASLALPIVLSALYGAGLAFYRLVFDPLARFPGPKLAALTRKYETYYEAVKNYEYLWKIKKLHQQYGECPSDGGAWEVELDSADRCECLGPIIRISPHELHIDDPEFFDKLNS